MPRVVVFGAGAFGGWTALELVRRGARVTLIDAWGPGHVRASSGGETRVIRAGYGSRAVYTRMAVRALARWRHHDVQFGRGFYRKTGALWMIGRDDGFGRATVAAFRAAGVTFDDLSAAEAQRRYPQVNFRGVRSVLVEPDAGRRGRAHDVVPRDVAEIPLDERGCAVQRLVEAAERREERAAEQHREARPPRDRGRRQAPTPSARAPHAASLDSGSPIARPVHRATRRVNGCRDDGPAPRRRGLQ